MKVTRSLTPVLFTTLLLPLGAFAQGPGEHEHSPVGKQMEVIQRDYRKLTRQYADPAQKASSLDLVAEMQKSAETAKGITPPGAEKKADAEKQKYLDAYKKDMDALLKELASLKDAIDAGDKDKAKAELDKINQLKGSSHKELGVKMGGGPGGPGGPGGQRRPGPPSGAPASGGDQKPSASPAAAAASPKP